MRKIEFEVGERLNALLIMWTFLAIIVFLVEKFS